MLHCYVERSKLLKILCQDYWSALYYDTVPVKLTFLVKDQVTWTFYIMHSNLQIYHCNTLNNFVIQYLYGEFLTCFLYLFVTFSNSIPYKFVCSYNIVTHTIFPIVEPCFTSFIYSHAYKKAWIWLFPCCSHYFRSYFIYLYKNKLKSYHWLFYDFTVSFKCKMNQLVLSHGEFLYLQLLSLSLYGTVVTICIIWFNIQ